MHEYDKLNWKQYSLLGFTDSYYCAKSCLLLIACQWIYIGHVYCAQTSVMVINKHISFSIEWLQYDVYQSVKFVSVGDKVRKQYKKIK